MAQFGKRGLIHDQSAKTRFPAPAANVLRASQATPMVDAAFVTATMSVKSIMFLLAAAAGFWFCILPYAGDIIRDHRLSGTWQPAYDMQVVDARCKRYNFIVTLCSARMKSRARPDQAQSAIGYMMAFSRGDEPVVPVRSTTDPSAVSLSSAAVTHLANRTMTFLVLGGGFAASILCSLFLLLAGRSAEGSYANKLKAQTEAA